MLLWNAEEVSMRQSCCIALVVSLFIPSATALANTEPPRPLDPNDVAGWDHLELSMGFSAGQRSWAGQSFAFEGGAAEAIDGAGALVAPFEREPFDGAAVYGLTYDARLVVSYVRMTIGIGVPFPSYRADTTTVTLDGTAHDLTVQSLSAFELRFGIGGEYAIGALAPFVDLLGSIHWIDSTLTVDGQEARYAARAFAFSARAGLRLHVRRWFFAAASGEVGLVGDVRWGADLSVGFAFL